MFGIGYQEMFIVLVVALVVFGPSRLPELAGQVGRWVRDFRRMSADLTGEFEKTFAEVDEVKRTIKGELKSIQDEVEGVGKSASKDLKRSSGKGRSGAKKGAAALKAGAGTGAKGASEGRGAALSAHKVAAAASSGGNGSGHRTEALDALPIATKADPLADVSFFDLDGESVAATNGQVSSNGNVAVDDDALTRVRRRRAAAAYSRRITS